MSWRRCAAVSGLALALIDVWTSVRAQPANDTAGKKGDLSAPRNASPGNAGAPGGGAPSAPQEGGVESGGSAQGQVRARGPVGRTTTKLRPQHSLRPDAGVSAGDAGVVAGDAGAAGGDAGRVGDAGLAVVDAGPLPPDDEPPPDDLPPVVRIPSAVQESQPDDSRASGQHAYGRKDPLLPHLRLDAHAALTWEGAFGVGARAEWLLIEGTFKYSQRDELAISAGCDVTFVKFDGSHPVEVFPTATLQWSIGVNERLFLYPELGILGHVDRGEWDGLFPNIGFGTRYYLRRSVGLQARLGWPIAFAAGAVF